MPLVAASEVFNSARVYLNDPNATLWTDALLLPYLKEAYEYARNAQALLGLPNSYKTSVQTVAASAVILPTLPTDLLLPIRLEERLLGSTDPYDPMIETVWDPNQLQTSSLNFWNWRNQIINFLGTLAGSPSRQVRMYYLGDMDPTSITTGTIDLLGNVRIFLGAKIAALVQTFALQNLTQAQLADSIAEIQLKMMMDIQIKNRQALPTRQKPFRAYPRHWGGRNY